MKLRFKMPFRKTDDEKYPWRYWPKADLPEGPAWVEPTAEELAADEGRFERRDRWEWPWSSKLPKA